MLQNDLITWLMETATHDYHFTPQDIAMRILVTNFASIHSSTMVRYTLISRHIFKLNRPIVNCSSDL